VIDGDTVRFNGAVYRLVGIDTPERGEKARCDDERRRAEATTTRLRALIGSADARLTRVACACRAGPEGTRNCNFGRLCGSLSIGGRDVGSILISEGLAHPYICGATNCPQRRPWCNCSVCTRMLVCVFCFHFARETAGAARTRLSLRPLFSRRAQDHA
jgi:endonuclease YncB( thermonuclease family)